MTLAKGEANPSGISIYVLGQKKAGKSCLVSTLLGDKFEERIATRGADVDVCTSNWSRIDKAGILEKLQKLFHTKLKVTAEIKISAKRVEPLSTASNKRELQQSLPELPAAVKADLEQAKAAVLVDDDGINVVIWDFAGQSVYHGLHSMFLKEDNLAMVVFDASQNLHDSTQGRNVVRDPYTEKSVNPTTTGAETVCYWLKAIHSICHKDGTKHGSKSKLVPVEFLVATHIDAIGDEKAIEQRKKQFIDWLVLLLNGKPYAQHLVGIGNGLRSALEKYCFFISNKVRNHKELDRLKAELVEASQYILSQQHPVVYLNIEKELFATNKAVITTKEFHTIASKCGFFAAIGGEEFKGALAHFHSKGTILHFPNAESLKELVFL
ncbi:probable serine/threonine-protein kinase pats1 [Dysidea avara]|uniref:probable serine/threonine-protein kinase pats1 n=1 Tax=Dysidea avara TaxID=196820 RepID=UPI00332A77B5